jgi:hypothetical protein
VTCAEQWHCRASSGSPSANLIADPLGTDGEDKHDERSKGDPKDRQEGLCGFHDSYVERGARAFQLIPQFCDVGHERLRSIRSPLRHANVT